MVATRSITPYGARLKQARKYAKLTQVQLAKKSGVKLSTLSELETVAHKSGFTAQLATSCGVDAHWLATGKGPMLATTDLHIEDLRGSYSVTGDLGPSELVAALARALEVHSLARRQTIGSVLARFAVTPGDYDVAAEAVRELTPDVPKRKPMREPQETRAGSK